MKEYQPKPPTASEIPHGSPEADDLTVKARKKVSALMAAFNSLWVAAGFDDICTKARIDAGELRRMYQVIIEMAMRAEEDAEKNGHALRAVRSFHITDWAAELCYRREFIPSHLSDAEKQTQRNSLAKAWRRRYYRTIHAAQCRNHLPFVERTSGKIINHRKVASVYVERMADVLAMIERDADPNRGRVSRYNRAALAAINHLRDTTEKYAPDFDYNPEPKASEPVLEPSEAGPEAVANPPYIKAIKRAVKLATKGMLRATAEEREIRLLELHEWVDADFRRRLGGDPENRNDVSTLYPVEYKVDTQKSGGHGAPEVVTKRVLFESENCEMTPENSDLPKKVVDIDVHLISQFSGAEYDPEPEPRGISLSEAEAAALACETVGAGSALVVWTDETLPPEVNCTSTDRFESIAEFRENLPRLLSRNDRSPVESMAVRIRWKGDSHLLQVDDCSPEVLAMLAPYSFMQMATSPESGQSWLAFPKGFTSEQYDELKSRLFLHLNPTGDPKGANGGAHGSVRWPGSLNRKPKRRYADGESPRVKLLRTQAGRTTSLAELEAAGLLAPPTPKPSRKAARAIRGSFPATNDWPDIDDLLRCHAGDRSKAEFAFCCRAIEAGWPQYRVEDELSRRGAKASTRTRDNYITETVQNAARKVGVKTARRITN